MFAATKSAINAQTSIPPTTTVSGITFSASGSYSFVVPSGVYQVSAVAIGGGGGGAGGITQSGGDGGGGGGGGALSCVNNLVVTPGETLTVVVGAAGTAGTGGSSSRTGGGTGGDTYLRRGATNLLLAKGGGGGNLSSAAPGGSASSGVGDIKYSGGEGGWGSTFIGYGAGGGGAAGYSGDGGNGFTFVGTTDINPTDGSGGGGGGAYYSSGGGATTSGGTLFYGEGTNGSAGTFSSARGRLGSAQGSSSTFNNTSTGPGGAGNGGNGNGGGGTPEAGVAGALRVVWGNSPAFPSTSVTQNTVSSPLNGASNSATINIPSGVSTGDLVVLFDQAIATSGIPASVTPSGFTLLTFSTGGTGRFNISCKRIVDPADAGTTITGMNSDTNKKIILVFRGSRGYGFTRSGGGGAEICTTATPASFTVASSSIGFADGYTSGIPIVLAGFYGSSGISTGTDITFSGATFVQGPDNTFWVGYKIYSQTTTSFSDAISMVDRGTNSIFTLCTFGY